MPSRDVLKRLETLESQEGPEQGPRIIRLILPHPAEEAIGVSLDMAGRKLYFPGDPEAGKDVLSAMYWLIYPKGGRVILATETGDPDTDALIIPPCPDDIDLDEYAAQQVQRLQLDAQEATPQ